VEEIEGLLDLVYIRLQKGPAPVGTRHLYLPFESEHHGFPDKKFVNANLAENLTNLCFSLRCNMV
jgi:hypothetical protein